MSLSVTSGRYFRSAASLLLNKAIVQQIKPINLAASLAHRTI